MIIARNDEEKRSKIWRLTVFVSSVLVIVIAIYFLTKLFASNPLMGKWESEDANYVLSIGKGSSLEVKINDLAEETDIKVKLPYAMDREARTITIKNDSEVLEKLAQKSDGAYSSDMLESALASITTSFDYSVDQEQLTLTEREYGEQIIFRRK